MRAEPRAVDNLIHYLDETPAALWLSLAMSSSPARTDGGAVRALVTGLDVLLRGRQGGPMDMIAVACGDASKEALLIRHGVTRGLGPWAVALAEPSAFLLHKAIDAVAAIPQATIRAVSSSRHEDLDPLGEVAARVDDAPRVVTLFGAVGVVHGNPLASARALLYSGEAIITSAYLIPEGGDQDDVLAGYSNEPTRAWLTESLHRQGVNRSSFDLRFEWQSSPGAAGRVVGILSARRDLTLVAPDGDRRVPTAGEIVIFESVRHSRGTLRDLLNAAEFDMIAFTPFGEGHEAIAVGRAR